MAPDLDWRRWRILLAFAACGLLCGLAGCGDGGDEGGGAGAPAGPGAIGQPCGNMCASGLVCGRTGAFVGLCTVGCNNDPSCQLITPATRCFGADSPMCGRPCATETDCLPGTTCTPVGSGRTACTLRR